VLCEYECECLMHILFDLDGTLTDPKEGILACIHFALSKLGIKIGKDANLKSYIGPPLQDTFKDLCGNEKLTENAVTLSNQAKVKINTKIVYTF